MTPEQAFTVLKEVFSELTAPQQQQLQPQQQVSSSQSHLLLTTFPRENAILSQQEEEEAVVGDVLSVTSIAQAFCAFRNDADDARSIAQEFIDSVFRFVYEQLIQSSEGDAKGMGSQLDIVNKIIHAAYCSCTETTPRYDSGSGPSAISELGMIFVSISTHLLEPVWSLLCDIRPQVNSHGSEGGEKSICILLQVEIVLASLLQPLLIICQDQGNEPHLAGLVNLCYRVARMFADAIIPMHLRTLQSLRIMPPESASASINKRFIGALMVLGGIFCESPLSEPPMLTTKVGDIIPDLDVLASFDYREIDPIGGKRRPFSYSKIVAGLQQSVHGPDNSFSLAYNAIKLHIEEILLWLWKHDGASTQELVAKGPPDILVTMMFMLLDTRFKIEANASVRERRLLEEDGDADDAKDVVEAGARFCASGYTSETELIYVWGMLNALVPLLKPGKGNEFLVKWEGYQDLDRVMGKLLLQVEQCQTGIVWEGQQQLVPFFRTMWSHIRLISLHLDVHDEDMFYHQIELLCSLWETIQEFMDLLLSPETFSQHLSTPPSSTAHHYNHHHNQRQHHDEPAEWHEVWSCVTDCAVEGMLLLHNTNAHFPELITLAAEGDRTLMVYYCLELMYVLMNGTLASQTPFTDPRELAFALVRWITTSGGGGSNGGDIEDVEMCEGPRVDLWSWLDLLLDCLSDSTLHETNDLMVWKTLRVYMEALLSCFHQGSPSSSCSTAAAKAPRFTLFIYPTPQADASRSWIQARLKYQGHKELLTGLWQRWNAAAKVVAEQMRRESMKQQEQDSINTNTGLGIQGLVQLNRVVSDILMLMRMIVHEGPKDDHHCRSLDLEFVDWIMNLIDSNLIDESSETLRELAAVDTAQHADDSSSASSPGDNYFESSLAELAKVREEFL
ncbi:hypothetical protein BGZ95_009307 [Linnemannia exigua]|uniref:Uncharacterized protein n=1 Tax=Linnemannia exigua TaxID=604196 RepID=A0AAD4DD65_9FUNG|nr:hypothetical protein BGZ95_009307 [Linnemannia exigua]